MTAILNTGIHAHLVELGYTYEHREADWEDAGDAENGPKLEGGPEYDAYEDNDTRIFVSHKGEVSELYPYDKAMEEAWEKEAGE